MNLTKFHVACYASIILLIALGGLLPARTIVRGGPTAQVCLFVTTQLLEAKIAILVFFRKLDGLRCSSYHAIAKWTEKALLLLFFAALGVLIFNQANEIAGRSYFGVFFAFFAFFAIFVALIAAVTVAMIPDPFTTKGIWIVFAFVLAYLIIFLVLPFVEETTADVVLSSVICIIFANLAVSTWIVATTPVVVAHEEEELRGLSIPLEATVGTRNDYHLAV